MKVSGVLVIAVLGFVLALGHMPVRAETYAAEGQDIETGALGSAQSQQPEAERVLVPVPRVTIYPGDVITNEMLADRDFAADGLPVPQAFAPRAALVGKVSKKTLLPNVPVISASVREPYLIKQGQATVVVFQQGGLVILATAVPLEAGSAGDFIKLRNVDSGTTIHGVVQSDGTVRVGLQ